jgi:hypothetical protein
MLTNRELVSKRKNINEDDLASNNNSPDDWFFWNGSNEYEIITCKNGKRIVKTL